MTEVLLPCESTASTFEGVLLTGFKGREHTRHLWLPAVCQLPE